MTMHDFETELKALLRKAENSGLDVDDFCGCAEYILQMGWADDMPTSVEDKT